MLVNKYQNPIIKGFYPDPSIIRVDDDYYLVTSSFHFLPGVPLFHSKDLIHWEQIGHCLDKQSQIDLSTSRNSGGIFAPTIRYYNGIYYMITTNVEKGNFIVKTDDLSKGFSDPIWLDIQGIDPSLFFEDNKVYVKNACFSQNKNYIQQVEVDIHTGEILTEPKIISYGCGGRDVEAPHIYYINNWYYLICAEGGTRDGHMITVQRSKNIYGPYENSPYNPMVTNRDKSKEILQAVGHGDLVQDYNGDWWIVALATRPHKHRHNLGRETILLPIEWSDDEWPYVKDGYAKIEIECNRVNSNQQKLCFRDNFTDTKLDYKYNSIRNFLKENYRIVDQSLILIGNNKSLNDLYYPIFLGVRQTEWDCIFETKMNISNLKENDFAGLTILIDNLHHMDIGIRNHQIVVRKNDADMKLEQSIAYHDDIVVTVGIKSSKDFYEFYYIQNNEQIVIDSTHTKHLSIENSFSPSTGVYGGMFIEGKGKAQFHQFIYKEI